MLLTGPSRVASRRRRGTTAFLTVATPVSPQPPGVPLVVSGTYGGTPSGIRVVWRQGGAEVGAAVAASVIAGGTWSATITTPATPGTYTLFAAFEGGGPTAESAPVTISTSAPATLAQFTFEGTGLGANTIALFGHGFERGTLAPTDPVVLRSAGDTLHRTQMNVLATWDDGSVKTALLAGELPALADGATLGVEFVRGLAHPDPGPNLSFASALSGRSALIRTWAPGNTTTPLWTFDVAAAALTATDRWHQGPLALSTRVETPVPPTAVQNTAGQTGQVASVRLVVDVIVTKDGFLELDVCFSNDRVMHPQGGIARFGYTIEIDGQVVYDQRPASGPARDLLQYAQWIRRRGRRPDGTVLTTWGSSNRPFFRPDFDLLVRSGLQLNFDRQLPLSSDALSVVPNTLAQGAGREADPYWHWGLARDAGTAGGRQEIGYRTHACAQWLRNGDRGSQELAMRQFEAAATRPMYYWDWELGRPVNVVDWPRFTLHHSAASPAGTSRQTANGLPSDQRPTHNTTDHITIDHAHHGSFNWTPALLAGRRLCYDGLAARVCWTGIDTIDRHGGALPWSYSRIDNNWRGQTPDHTTGRAWGAQPWHNQVRSWAWDFRDHVDCAAILPDAWPNRPFYDRTVAADVNAFYDLRQSIYDRLGTALGIPLLHAGGNMAVGFMFSFIFYGVMTAARLGLGGPNLSWFLTELARFRLGSVLDPAFNYRNAASGRDIYVRGTAASPPDWATTWAEVQAKTAAAVGDTSADWSVNPAEGDWQRNVLSGLALLSEYGPSEEIRAQAMDALVLLRSERSNPTNNHPRIGPEAFFGGFFMTNSVIPPHLTWRTDLAPTIPPGQSFSVPLDAPQGTLVGRIRVVGPFPRNSAAGRGVDDAFVIVTQPAGNPFTVSPGGAIRVANPAALQALGAGPRTIQVYCRTWNQLRTIDPAVEHRSATVAVTVTLTAEAPFIAPAGPFTVGNNAPLGAFVGQLTVTGTQPITMSIVAGDPQGRFAVSSSGRVTVAADLSGEPLGNRSLTFRAVGPGGQFDRQVTIEITAPVFPPVIAPGQTLTVEEGRPIGTPLTPDLAISGTPPTQLSIIAGDPEGRFEAVAPNRIRTAAVLVRSQQASYALTVRAVNSAGQDEKPVAVTVTQEAWIWGGQQAVYLAAYDLSQRLRQNHAGPLFRARRVADGVEQDFGAAGSVTPAEIQAFANGGRVELAALYDQSGRGNHLETPSAHGRPWLTNAAGQAYVLNGRPTVWCEGARGLKRTNFATLGTADFGAFALFRWTTAPGGSGGNRLLSLSAADNGEDMSGTTSLRLAFGSDGNARLSRNNGEAFLAGTTANTTWLMAGITSNEAGWGRRLVRNTTSSGTTTATFTAMNAMAAFRLGYFADNGAQDRCLVGHLGTVLIVGAIDKTTALPAIRDWLMQHWGLA